jgi:hypothetical protein
MCQCMLQQHGTSVINSDVLIVADIRLAIVGDATMLLIDS